MKEESLSAGAALAAFSEPYVESRRVLVFGSSLSATPRLLVERGARLVQVCDPNPARVEEAAERLSAPGLSFTTFSDELLQAREASFDFVLVENLAAFEARAVVARARRLLAARGVALFATPNRESAAPLLPPPEPAAAPLDYYALYDLVAAEFDHVHMLGQAPFVGYAVVDFASEGNLEPMIDSEFVPRGSEEPELFLALASRHRISVASYAVVQLPMHRVLSRAVERVPAAPPPVATRTSRGATPDLESRLERQEAWILELEGRAEAADARADTAEEELETARAELTAARVGMRSAPAAPRDLDEERRVSAELAAATDEKRRLASELAAATDEKRELAAELAAATEEKRGLAAELTTAIDEKRRLAARAAELEATLVERESLLLKRDVAILDRDRAIAERDEKLTALEVASGADSGDDLAALERQLEDRGRALRHLEHSLAEAERVGRALVEDLTRVRPVEIGASAEALDELGAALARSEADRLALAWCAAIGGASAAPKD